MRIDSILKANSSREAKDVYKNGGKIDVLIYHIYPAIRRGFWPSRMTSNN